MSYVSLLKNIPEILSRPTGIAVIASLGIHGAIALIVPLMPVDSDSSQPSEVAKSVGILELSQADQARLPENPQISPETSPSSIPAEWSLPPRPPLLPPNLDIPRTIPPSPSSVYTQPVLPPMRTRLNYQVVPPPNRNVSSPQRTATAIPAPRVESELPGEQYRFTSDFNAAAQKFTPSTRTFNHSEIQVAVKPIPVEGLPKVTPSPVPGDLANTRPTTAAVNNADLVARLQESRQQPEQPSHQSTPKLQSESRDTKPESAVEKVNAARGAMDSGTARVAIAHLNSHQDIREQIQQDYPNSKQKPVIRDTIAVNQPRLEGKVWGFLVVGTEGQVLDIKFPKGLVSTELQSKAREYFTTRSPQGDQQVSIYPFNLSFQKDGNTAATTVKPLPELRVPNEQSAPAQAVTAKTTPEPNNSSLSSTLESSEKLIQQLRQVREERTNSNLEESN
jgi:hypothetical protein